MIDTGYAANAVPVAGELLDARPRKHRTRRRSRIIALIFFLPAIAVNLFVIGGPAVSSIVYAFTNWNGISPPDFVGFANWERMFSDEAFWAVMRNNVVYLLVLLTIPTSLGLLGAFLLTRIRHGATLFRVIYFIPYLLITVVTAQIWRNLLNPDTGIAAALNSIGIPWLNDVYFLG